MLSLIKTIIHKVYILALMAFTIWYGFFLYPIIFGHAEADGDVDILEQELAALGETSTEEERQFEAALKEQQKTATTNLGYMVVKEQYVQGHFHHVGMTVEADDTSLCIRCHGAVPHDKAKAIRAFLNMHAFYVACETCHIMPEEGSGLKYDFRWYDKDTGSTMSNPAGLTSLDKSMYGNYGAKIAPGELDAQGNFRFVNDAKERAFVEKYLKEKDRLGSTQQSKMKKVIHRKVVEKPLLCDGCHTDVDKAYLPYAELGYPKRRMSDLTGTEVAGMVAKYQEFYMPKFLMPGKGWNDNGEGAQAPEAPAEEAR